MGGVSQIAWKVVCSNIQYNFPEKMSRSGLTDDYWRRSLRGTLVWRVRWPSWAWKSILYLTILITTISIKVIAIITCHSESFSISTYLNTRKRIIIEAKLRQTLQTSIMIYARNTSTTAIYAYFASCVAKSTRGTWWNNWSISNAVCIDTAARLQRKSLSTYALSIDPLRIRYRSAGITNVVDR